jgi:hypothetical protein
MPLTGTLVAAAPPIERVAEMAFALDQVSIAEPPGEIVPREDEIVQVGSAGAALTTTGTLQSADPVALVTVRR